MELDKIKCPLSGQIITRAGARIIRVQKIIMIECMNCETGTDTKNKPLAERGMTNYLEQRTKCLIGRKDILPVFERFYDIHISTMTVPLCKLDLIKRLNICIN